MAAPSASKTVNSLRPILILCQFSGLFPFKLKSLRLSRLFAGISLTLMFTITSALIVNLTGPNALSFDNVSFLAFKALTVCPSVSGVALLAMGFTLKTNLSVVMRQLLIVERRFPRRKRNFPRLFFIWEMSFRFVVILVQLYLNYLFVAQLPIQQYLIRVFGIFLTHYLQNLYELQFLAFVDVTTRWYCLCRHKLSLRMAEVLVECHKDLSKACRALEDAYCRQNLIDILDNVTISTINLFYLRATTRNWAAPLTVQLILRIILKLYQLFVTTLSATCLYDQATKFDESLYTMMIGDDTKLLLGKDKVTTHLSRRNKVIFTGGRLCSVQTPLMHTIAALIVNYLVILIQFGGGDHTYSSEPENKTEQIRPSRKTNQTS